MSILAPATAATPLNRSQRTRWVLAVLDSTTKGTVMSKVKVFAAFRARLGYLVTSFTTTGGTRTRLWVVASRL